MRRGTGRQYVVALALCGLLGALAFALAALAEARRSQPNLLVTAVSEPPRQVAEGGAFAVKDTVRNAGRASAGKSDTRFYLTPDPKRSLRERRASRTNPRSAPGDLLLAGARPVPALRPGAASATRRRPAVRVIVPPGAPAGAYHLLACADDRGSVAEGDEADNCRASKRKVTIRARAVGTSLRVDAFSDTLQQPEVEQDESILDALRPLTCPPTSGAKVPSLRKAIAASRSFLEAKAGKDAMRAFARSPEYRNANRAQAAAGAAVIAGQPGAALAALLRAHELEPRDASHLVNAAAMATSVGLPAQGLAMVDAAARLDDRDLPGMGVSRQAAALANRGQALAMLSRNEEAESSLQAALGSEPLLTEAASTLSVTSLCRGDRAAAVRFLRRGRKRQEREDPGVDHESTGKESSLRNLPLPAFPAQAPPLYEFYRQQNDAHIGEIQRRNQREQELRQRINAQSPPPSRLTERRRNELLTRVSLAGKTPELEALNADFAGRVRESHRIREEMWCEGDSCHDEKFGVLSARANSECQGAPNYSQCYRERLRSTCIPTARQEHQAWLNEITRAYELAQQHFRAVSRRASGIASNIKDPDTYALALLRIELLGESHYFTLHQSAFYQAFWTRMNEEYCVQSPEPPPDTTSAPEAPKGSGPCPPELKAINAVISLGPLSLKANCDEVTLEGDTGGWISAFGEVTYDRRTGSVTVFGGSKGSIGAGGAKGEFKSGIYVRVGQNGPEDVGWRVGPSTSVGGGPVEFSGASDQIDLSFVGALSSTGGT